MADEREPVRLDRALLGLRDYLELQRAAGDTSQTWRLLKVRKKISERARQACLEAESGNEPDS